MDAVLVLVLLCAIRSQASRRDTVTINVQAQIHPDLSLKLTYHSVPSPAISD